jgi:ElaB/YqjD/DUF883 family membrane-anchored ribosome-binding protein
MNQDRIRNGMDRAVRGARDVAGGVLSNARARLDDGAEAAAERAEDAYEATLKSLEGATRDRPLTLLAMALGIGFVVGLLTVRR